MKVICTICLLLCVQLAHAQTQHTDKEYARTPYWIDMIKDTSVNFFEAERAYKIYFQHHEKPEGEQEDIGEHKKREKYPSKHEQREMQKENHMRMDVKRYEHWRDMVRPYVQSDGRILTPSERVRLYKKL
jgi:hypothetical protein